VIELAIVYGYTTSDATTIADVNLPFGFIALPLYGIASAASELPESWVLIWAGLGAVLVIGVVVRRVFRGYRTVIGGQW